MNDVPAGGEMGEKESGPFRARLSNLSYYAATGVKAQVFVPILFRTNLTSQESKYYQYVVGTNDDVKAS
jgi:hypothetical protein